jgi:hypothetical protein
LASREGPATEKSFLTLIECNDKINTQSSVPKTPLDELEKRLHILSEELSASSATSKAEVSLMHEEEESIDQGLTSYEDVNQLVQRSRRHISEDITSGDKVSQVIIATLGDVLTARRVTTGLRLEQWLGQMSDETVQILSKERRKPTKRATDHSSQDVPGSGRSCTDEQSDRSVSPEGSTPPQRNGLRRARRGADRYRYLVA